MGYKLGKRSLSRLEGVNEELVTVVKYAIGVTKQDFSVICGLRTIDEQRALVAKGASQTMKSKHIDGNAVDLMAYCDGGRWELNLYDEIADAMKEGAAACLDERHTSSILVSLTSCPTALVANAFSKALRHNVQEAHEPCKSHGES